jgi:ABC-type transport system substrate-binding protein
MKQLLTLICGAILIVAYAQAQTSPSSSSTTSKTKDSATTASTTHSSGTVTEYAPGATITLDPGTGKPVHFVIGKKVQVIGPDGKVLADTDVKKNAKVEVHLVQEGDHTVVDKINVEELKR